MIAERVGREAVSVAVRDFGFACADDLQKHFWPVVVNEADGHERRISSHQDVLRGNSPIGRRMSGRKAPVKVSQKPRIRKKPIVEGRIRRRSLWH